MRLRWRAAASSWRPIWRVRSSRASRSAIPAGSAVGPPLPPPTGWLGTTTVALPASLAGSACRWSMRAIPSPPAACCYENAAKTAPGFGAMRRGRGPQELYGAGGGCSRACKTTRSRTTCRRNHHVPSGRQDLPSAFGHVGHRAAPTPILALTASPIPAPTSRSEQHGHAPGTQRCVRLTTWRNQVIARTNGTDQLAYCGF